MKNNKFGVEFDVVETDLNGHFWRDYYSFWENSTFEYLLNYLNKDKTFIDIGAWIGPISMVAQQYSKNCICFEPDPFAYDEFVENIKLNNFDNIILEKKAVSIHDTISIGCEVLGQSGTRDSCELNQVVCECITIKEILDKYNLNESNISVIKIDIEGHEEELLKDKTLMDLNIPMHISLHPAWKQDKIKFFDDIRPFFFAKGIDISKYPQDGFYDIVIN